MNGYEEEYDPLERKSLTGFEAMVHLRCPECKKGIVYRRGMEMNHLCPYCGIKFDREPGYFSGSIWISLIVATPVSLFFMFCLVYFFHDLHPALAGIFASLLFIPLVPLTIRFSRSAWMYLDHQMNPQRSRRRPPDNGGDQLPLPAPVGPGYTTSAEVPAESKQENFIHCVDETDSRMLHPTQ